MRVLVVEDEALLAFDIASHLSAAGFEVVGPALRLADAMSLIDRIGCDAAILDVNLGDGTTSEPAAIELRRRHIPFLVLSGYSPDQHPPALQGAVHLSKPAKISILLSSLRKLGSLPPSKAVHVLPFCAKRPQRGAIQLSLVYLASYILY